MLSELIRIQRELEFSYQESLRRYNTDEENLLIKRDFFYRDNPNFPDKNLFMSVTNPPARFNIEIIN